MNDLTAAPSAIEGYGGKVSAIGSRIAADIDGRSDGLDAATEGLKTPGVFAGVVDAWTSVCHGVSGEVDDTGVGITESGVAHAANEEEQEAGMRAKRP